MSGPQDWSEMIRHHSALHGVAPQVRYVLDFGIVRKMVFDEERAMQSARRGDSEHEMPVARRWPGANMEI